jgi:4-amino-4-deoxy-L-arabinose transferase-like glycosyltransferase
MKTSGDTIFSLHISRRWESLLFLLLIGLCTFLRFLYLSSDPPNGISLSTGIETDPPQYTLYARSEVLTGDWNPYGDNRYITYQYSLVTLVSRVVFGGFGIGTYQANLVGVILSLLSIFLFYLVLRKSFGNGVALLALFFIGTNYIGIFYGRRPFLENGMILLSVLALAALVFWEKKLPGHFLFGILVGTAIFFGKVIALAFLGVPVVYYLYKGAVLRNGNTFKQAAAMLAGLLILSATWFFLIYKPNTGYIQGYITEQAFGLYGYPEAFDSISKFIWKFLSFGIQSAFFDRMPMISTGSLVLIIIAAGRRISRDRQNSSGNHNLLLVSIIAWLFCFYIAEMPWNYRPLRYQTVMIFPLSTLAAILIAYLYNQKKAVNILNRSHIFNIVLFVLLMLFTYQIIRVIVVGRGGEFNYRDYISLVTAIALLVSFIYYILSWRMRKFVIELPRSFRYTLIGLIIVVSLYYQSKNYLAWADLPLYTARQASRDLSEVISPGAVLSGPYGPALALDNNLGCVIHFFGTSRPNPGLFRLFPITHLALDKANEGEARRLYPDVMNQAVLVSNYNINCKKVSVYKIAPYTGNRRALGYSPSVYEHAAGFYAVNQPDSGDYYLARFLELSSQNMTGYMWAGLRRLDTGDFGTAIEYFERAIEFSPTDFNLHFFLGNAYIAQAQLTGDESVREKGEAEIDSAHVYCLGKFDLVEYMIKDPKDRENGRTGEK